MGSLLTSDKKAIIDRDGNVLIDLSDLQSSDDLTGHFPSSQSAAFQNLSQGNVLFQVSPVKEERAFQKTSSRSPFQKTLPSSPNRDMDSDSSSSFGEETVVKREHVEYANPRFPLDDTAPPASQLSQEFSQIVWSASPVSHRTETLLSRAAKSFELEAARLESSDSEIEMQKITASVELKGEPRDAQIEPRKAQIMPKEAADEGTGSEIGKIKPVNDKVGQSLVNNRPKTMPWNATSSTTKQSRLNLRKLNVQRRQASTNSVSSDRSLRSDRSESLKPKGNLPKIFLSKEQRAVLDIVVHKEKNVFFTGAAGTGKSVLLRRIIQDLRYRYGPDRVAVTASTGLAACNIGGITLHSFAGIGLGKDGVENMVKRLKRDRKRLRRWRLTKVLVIDEISMIDGDLFDKLDELARILRNQPDMPFGGIQIVLTGDFFQLPPVRDQGKELKFTFEASKWNDVIEETIVLVQVFRQKDNRFSTILNEMRRGQMTAETVRIFRALHRDPVLPDGITPTELYPRRFEVDRANISHLKALPGEMVTFDAEDHYNNPESQQFYNLNNMMAVEKLSIKRGAQVMMIKNMDETLVNGSVGIVMGFMSESTFKMTEVEGLNLSSQELNALLSDEPHKQNKLDDVFGIPESEEDMENDNEFGWKRKRARLEILKHNSEHVGRQWPYVRFYINDGTTRDVLVQPETWTIEDHEGKVMASRTQVPLILAWALSIHKSQGQTLEWVKVDLAKTFEKGQAYVAISRAVSLEGLQVLNFFPARVMVHQKVVEFYDSLDVVLRKDRSEIARAKAPTVEQHDFSDQEDFISLSAAAPSPKPEPLQTTSKYFVPKGEDIRCLGIDTLDNPMTNVTLDPNLDDIDQLHERFSYRNATQSNIIRAARPT